MRLLSLLSYAGLCSLVVGCLELADYHSPQCVKDHDCGNYASCVDYHCHAKVCSSSADCYLWDECHEGTCQPKPCVSDAGCPLGSAFGRCAPDTSGATVCHSASYCSSDSMCAAPLVCIDTNCEARLCTHDDDCYPYRCNGSSCTTACTSNYDCHAEGMCIKDRCINPACTAETESKCSGFGCDLTTSKCVQYCGVTTELVGSNFVTTQYGCAAGRVCDRSENDCVLPCTTVQSPDCGGYVCVLASKLCQKSCSSAADCITGYYCQDYKCTKGTCSSSASCSGYVCVNGQCSTVCATEADCATGYQCIGSKCL